MKRQIIIAFILIFMGANMRLTAQTGNSRIFVAYFSWSGNAKTLAGQIAQVTGGNLFEIKTIKTYPNTYDECTKVARQEQNNNARPEISGSIANMDQYDIIFLCYPIWYSTMPMAVFTFLETYNLSGKTIYPLATHGGSGFGRSLDDIKKLCPQAVIGKGISVNAFDKNPNDNPRVTTPNRDVTAWLNGIGLVR